MPDNKKEKNEIPVGESVKNLLNDKNNASDKNKSQRNSPLFYILTILTALLLVVLIIGGAFFFAIKNNVNGIADSMRDSIDKVPVLRLALPKKPEPEDEKNMTEEQVRLKYTELRGNKAELEKQLEDLKKQVDELDKQLSAKDTNSGLLQQQKDVLEKDKAKLTSDNASLQKQFNDLSDIITKGDTASYKNYFEKIDPAKASELYEQILKDEKMSADVKKYVSIYEQMDASAVSKIMEQLGSGKMTLIIDIMKNLKKETSAAILSSMTPEFAAKVSEQLAKEYNVGTAKTTK